MVEKELEKKIIDIFAEELGDLTNKIGLIGVWQTTDNYDVKSEEESDKSGWITVKVNPRMYDISTTPTANIYVETSIVLKSDVDYNGNDFVEVSEKILNVLHKWQKSYDDAADDLDIENVFSLAGFNMQDSTVGIDRDNAVFQLSQNYNLYGLVI